MKSPFPGMDPYLEQAGLWNQVHHDLISDVRRFLMPLLLPKYSVAIEQLTYLSIMPPCEPPVGRPDGLIFSKSSSNGFGIAPQVKPSGSVAVITKPRMVELPTFKTHIHKYLVVRHMADKDVVTVIEILSPANKIGVIGRKEYEEKRIKILSSLTNLVEIDLLQTGDPLPMSPVAKSDYRIIVCRSYNHPKADAYLFGVRDIVPDIPIPLYWHDPEIILPLNQILHELYEKSRYDVFINYDKPPKPQLSKNDVDWARELITCKY